MALREVTRTAGHWLKGLIFKIDSEIQFNDVGNPLLSEISPPLSELIIKLIIHLFYDLYPISIIIINFY